MKWGIVTVFSICYSCPCSKVTSRLLADDGHLREVIMEHVRACWTWHVPLTHLTTFDCQIMWMIIFRSQLRGKWFLSCLKKYIRSHTKKKLSNVFSKMITKLLSQRRICHETKASSYCLPGFEQREYLFELFAAAEGFLWSKIKISHMHISLSENNLIW